MAESKPHPSPTATGGAGESLESRVLAHAFAALLIKAGITGLPYGVVTSVASQRASDDRPLDDVIIGAEGPDGPLSLDLQVKRTVSIGENEVFNAVMAQCWETIRKDRFSEGRDRVGFVIGTQSRDTGRHQEVLAWARHSVAAAEFFQRIKAVGGGPKVTFVTNVREALDRITKPPVSDEELWRLLRHLVILPMDFEAGEMSKDRRQVIERLSFALEVSEADRAEDLWTALIDIAGGFKAAAGVIDRAGLVEQLQGRFVLAPGRDVRRDLKKLRGISERTLRGITDDIAGVHLPREGLLDAALDHMSGGHIVELAGEKGSGKSVLLRRLAETQADAGPVLVLTADRMPPDAGGWEALASHWAFQSPLETLIDELASAPNPCLFIDALDRIRTPGAWATIRDVFDGIARSAGADRWTIVTTVRNDGLDHRRRFPIDALPGFSHRRVTVGDLDDEDIRVVIAAHDALRPMFRSGGRAAALARRPIYLSLLLRNPHVLERTGSAPFTEIDLLLEIWTDDGGGSNSLRHDRQATLLDIGRRRLSRLDRPVRSDALSSGALESLERDGIIQHDAETGIVRFRHDVLEDWTLCHVLYRADDGIAAALLAAEQAPWLRDAVQLLATWHLEASHDAAAWVGLLDEVSGADLELRWRQAILTAPLRTTRAFEALSWIEPALRADDCALLKEMMVALRTTEVIPLTEEQVAVSFISLSGLDHEELSWHFAYPRVSVWSAFLSWLQPRLRKLPAHLVVEVVNVLETLVRSAGIPDWLARTVAPLVLHWLRVLEYRGWPRANWIERHKKKLGLYFDRERELEKRLREILLACAQGSARSVDRYLTVVERRPHHHGMHEVIAASNRLVPVMPARLVDFMLTVLLMPVLEQDTTYGMGAMNDLGIRNDRMGFFPASHLRPPFLELLKADPSEGLRLINGLCAHAMEVWRSTVRREYGGTPLPIQLSFPWGERSFWGHAREFTWYRGLGPGPYVVMSALMALEVWMEGEVKAGRDMADLFKQVLEGNDCVGAVGACVSLCLADPGKNLDVALPFVTHPLLLEYDIKRQHEDRPGRRLGWLTPGRINSWLSKQVTKRDELEHRRYTLRELFPLYLVDARAQIRNEFRKRISDLEKNEPMYDFAESKEDQGWLSDWRCRAQRLTALADPANWRKSQPDADGRVMLVYQPPEDLREGVQAIQDRQAALSEAGGPLIWAEKCLEADALQPGASLDEALKVARRLDHVDLFDRDSSPLDVQGTLTTGCVSAVAAVATRFGSDLSPDVTEWCRSVLHRAANQHVADDFTFRDSHFLSCAPINAAHGLAGLLERGLASPDDRAMLMLLAAHPLEQVAGTVFAATPRMWGTDPLFVWQLLALGTRVMVMPWHVIQGRSQDLHYSDEETALVEAALDEAWSGYEAGVPSPLGSVPLRWVRADDTTADPADRRAWRRSDDAFLRDLAPIILFHLPLDRIMAEEAYRTPFLALVDALLEWTLDDLDPPWEDESGSGDMAYEWIHGFMDWCAQLTPGMTADEAWDRIWRPITTRPARRHYSRSALYLPAHFVEACAIHRFQQDTAVDAELARLWTRIAEWLFSHPESRAVNASRHIGSEYKQACDALLIVALGRCRLSHPWPALDAITPIVARWAETLAHHRDFFATLMTFLKAAGWPLMHGSALNWLADLTNQHGKDRDFWAAHDNGEDLAEVLDRLLEEHGAEIVREPGTVQMIGTIADILVGHGIRRAARVQQRLATLARAPHNRPAGP
jgi:hypothetical protein